MLIAFAVNDYWSERQDREIELQYLKRLHADLKSDEEWVSNYIENSIPRKMAALDAIAPVIRGREPVPEDKQEFFMNVMLGAIGGASPNYFVTTTTFEDLKATGHLRLVGDTAFRSAINKYYVDFNNNHNRVLARTTGYYMFVHGILPSELRQDIDMRAIQIFGVEKAFEKILSEEFRELLNQEYNFGYFLQRTYPLYASSADELSQLVTAQIRRLESS